jgi:hypothetical protein
MLVDKFLMFGELQAVTATAASTDYLDFSAFRNVGIGPNNVELFCFVGTAVTAAGAATVTFSLECDDNSAFSSATTLYTTAAIGKATLVAGYNALAGVKIPEGCERYVQLRYTVATGPLTAGTFTAGLCLAGQSFRAYHNLAL